MSGNKTQRTLLLIKLLRQRPRNSLELAAEIGCSHRSVYRYINELRQAGYQIRGKTGNSGYYELME